MAVRSKRSANQRRDRIMLEKGYRDWSNKKLGRSLRITRESFELILGKILMDLIKMSTPMKPNPIPPETQLALYRLPHGCNWSISTNC